MSGQSASVLLGKEKLLPLGSSSPAVLSWEKGREREGQRVCRARAATADVPPARTSLAFNPRRTQPAL